MQALKHHLLSYWWIDNIASAQSEENLAAIRDILKCAYRNCWFTGCSTYGEFETYGRRTSSQLSRMLSTSALLSGGPQTKRAKNGKPGLSPTPDQAIEEGEGETGDGP